MPSKWTINTKRSAGFERRQSPRYPFTASWEALELESQMSVHGRTADLSEGGCYVDTMSPLPAQTRIKVRITHDAQCFESFATVVYAATGIGMGLRFDKPDPQQVSILKKWLGELTGEPTVLANMEPASESDRSVAESCLVLDELVGELIRKGVLAQAAA